tara:strand:- start:240 stop:389 length:150 start_codon:yes stop_codon:yes gene_type:complete
MVSNDYPAHVACSCLLKLKALKFSFLRLVLAIIQVDGVWVPCSAVFPTK